jgi:two-component system LytT family response regulator
MSVVNSVTAVDRIRTLIADDEKPARTRLLALLEPRSDVEVVGVARDGREAVELIHARQPDLLFLDIHMPQLDGFGVLREISPARIPLTIFVTAHDRYAIRAFEAHAVDYLLKPFSDERFDTALDHARKSLRHATKADWMSRISNLLGDEAPAAQSTEPLERIVLRSGGRVTFLELKDLDWISAAGVYLHLHIGGKSHLYRSSISAFLQRLDPQRFVRVHRSTVVNTERIRELRPRGHGDFTIVLHDGRELTLSRAYRSQLERWLRQPL